MTLNKWFLRFITALLLACILTGSASAATELITNGDFSSGWTGWEHNSYTTGSGATALLTLQYPGVLFNQYLSAYEDAYAFSHFYQSVTFKDTTPTLTFTVRQVDYGSTGAIYPGLTVFVGGTEVFSIQPTDMSSSATTYTVDVSRFSGTTQNIVFESAYGGSEYQTTPRYSKFIVSDISLLDIGERPALSSPSLSENIIEVGQSVTAEVTVDVGYPTQTLLEVNFGDGTTEYVTVTSDSTQTVSHTYTATGTYTVTAQAANTVGYSSSVSLGVVDVISMDFTASPYAGTAPLSVQFYPDIVGFTSCLWDFGDGSTSQEVNPIHTYSDAGIYTVTLTGYTSSGKSYSLPKANLINTNPQSISFNSTSYTAGDTALISWQLRSPDYDNYQYTLQILPSDSLGNPFGQTVITPVSLSGSSGTYEWDTTGSSGYYTAVVIRSGGSASETLLSTTTNVISTATLTVNLAANGVTYTNTTTITLSNNGQITATDTTTTGQAQFTVPTGSYLVSATTTGYATQSATVNLIESTAITIDFITGTTDNPYPSGSGQYYPSTYATFRVLDKKYGTEVSGATITGYAVEATNPIEWLANIYGQAWGGKIIGSEINAITDENGLASFVMFTNVRYTLSLSHPDLPNPVNRTFALTSLSTEYPWYIDIPHEAPSTGQTDIKTTASVDTSGLINITYTDLSASTTLVTVSAYKKDDQNNYTISMGNPATAIGNENTIQLQLENFAGADVKIIVTAETTAHGTIERTYYHTFPGPWLDLGLPHNIYIWICLITAILLGGITPFVNSHACCFVICFIEWAYWMFGWFFDIGQGVAAFLLMTATILSIAYYIASRR